MSIKLAENIKKFRTERGMTQKALAEALLVTPQSVSRWEAGQVYPDIEMLPRIAEIFKVSLDTLMGTGMSFVQRKRKELSEARKQATDGRDFAARRKVCGILEELASAGTFQTQFLSEALTLYQIGGIDIDTVERAREYCRELLMKSSGDRRMRYLSTILLVEDPQNLERWREFVTEDSFCSCWDDLLLLRFTHCPEPERFEPARQRVIRQALRKLIINLVLGRPDRDCYVGSFIFQALNPYETYKLAMDILDLFSTNTGDILLDLKIYVEIRMAAALFAEGRDEEGFSTLETVLTHIEAFENLHNTVRRGSTGILSEIELPTSEDDIRGCLSDVDFQMRRREYDRVRDDVRFVALYRRVNGMDAADNDALMQLFDYSREKALGKNDLVLAVLTAGGVSRKAEIHNFQKTDANGAHPDEQAFINALREAGDTDIRYIVCLIQWGHLDLPSYFFRKKLLELNPDNGKAKILLNGSFRYIVKTVDTTLPPKKHGSTWEMNESYLNLARAVIRRTLPQMGTNYQIFKHQYENAEVTQARMFKRGFDLRFRIKDGVPAAPEKGQKTYGTVSALIPSLAFGMGFILWVKDGVIHSLEGYSYEEDLPETVEQFTLHDNERMNTHVCRAEFNVTGDFDPEWLEEKLGIAGMCHFKKGNVDPITERAYAFTSVTLRWAEEFGADIDANNVIRKSLQDILPLTDTLAALRLERKMYYTLFLRSRMNRDLPESAPRMSLDPDIIEFLNATQTRHELDIIM